MSAAAPPLNVALRECADAASAAQRLAQALAVQLRHAIAQRGQALLAVSGGRSPTALFQALRTQALPWAQVTVLLVDERCVPPTHADSNAALVRAHLLQDEAAKAQFMPFFDELPESWREEAANLSALTESAQSRLRCLPWPLDVAVLGMGDDGHTASLFPGAPGLAQALAGEGSVAWVRPLGAPHARLTLSLPVLQQARHVHLALAGPAKRAILDRACAQASVELPVSLVLHRPGEPVQVWCSP